MSPLDAALCPWKAFYKVEYLYKFWPSKPVRTLIRLHHMHHWVSTSSCAVSVTNMMCFSPFETVRGKVLVRCLSFELVSLLPVLFCKLISQCLPEKHWNRCVGYVTLKFSNDLEQSFCFVYFLQFCVSFPWNQHSCFVYMPVFSCKFTFAAHFVQHSTV